MVVALGVEGQHSLAYGGAADSVCVGPALIEHGAATACCEGLRLGWLANGPVAVA